jgi:hypothetical protein
MSTKEEQMPRYNFDPTTVQLYPDCPPGLAAFRAAWDRETEELRASSPRLTANQLRSVVLRRWQEAIARLSR